MHPSTLTDRIKARVRDVPDFPQKGILFRDITPVLEDAALLRDVMSALAEPWRKSGITKVVAVESRGFIFGAPLALELDAGFVLVRKPGKLPHRTLSTSYALEYGQGVLEMHEDAIRPADKVLVVDDLLATGGTAEAAAKLAHPIAGSVAGYSFLVELSALGGRQRLSPLRVEALITY